MKAQKLGCTGIEPNIGKRLQDLLENRWLPRDYEMVARFISSQMLPGKQYAFFGAGSYTKKILERLNEQEISPINAIFDSTLKKGHLFQIPIIHISKYRNIFFDKLFLSHNCFEITMLSDVRKWNIDQSKIVSIFSNPLYADYLKQNSYIEKHLKTPLDIPENKKIIVFVSMLARKIVSEHTLELLKKKDNFFFVNLKMESATEIEHGNDYFDLIIDCKESFLVLAEWIKRLNPNLIYITDQFSYGSICFAILKELFPNMKFVTELYDILELAFDDPYILSRESYWEKIDVDTVKHCERLAITESDGFIYKEGGIATKEFISVRKRGSLQFQQYLSNKNIHHTEKKHPSDPIKLVWAGSIIPSSYSKEIAGDNQMTDLFRMLIDQGFDITAFVNIPDVKTITTMYSDYIEISKETGRFRILPFMPRDKLIDLISKEFDYASILTLVESDIPRRIGFQTSMPSKMFTYLAAGLPILVCEECEVIADFVTSNGIGRAFSKAELLNADRIIKGLPYEKYKMNIKYLAQELSSEAKVDDLYEYISGIISPNNC